MKQLLLTLCYIIVLPNVSLPQLVINEIFADPSPVVGLPNSEYIELLNTSNSTVTLNDWQFSDASRTVTFSTSIELQPNQLIILCHEDEMQFFSNFGQAIGLNLPSLNNSGDELQLISPAGDVIDEVHYNISWYKDAIKDDGGWSLERINPYNTCDGEANWSASVASIGGTPGMVNSIIDETFINESELLITNVYAIDANTIKLHASKPIYTDEIETHFQIDPQIGISDIHINFDKTEISLFLSEQLITTNNYQLLIDELEDCARFTSLSDTIAFGLPKFPEQNDIVLNELLFNPSTGGVDFIELANISNQYLTVDELIVVELDAFLPSVVLDYYTINEQQTIAPNDLIVLTSNKAILQEQYDVEFPDKIVETAIPNFPDEEGIVVILNTQLDTLDQLHYYADWHFDGLSRVDGVSLERLNKQEDTNNETNWYSASSTIGSASPTAENSQAGNLIGQATNTFTALPKVFTPDNDGRDDRLIISFGDTSMGAKASVFAYSVSGYLVKTILNNQLIGSTNRIVWDGLSEDNTPLPIGQYIIVAEIYDNDGNNRIEKQTILLSRTQ